MVDRLKEKFTTKKNKVTTLLISIAFYEMLIITGGEIYVYEKFGWPECGGELYCNHSEQG